MEKSLIDGDDSYTRGAYLLVCRLRDRNANGRQDIPVGHAPCDRDFFAVLESLQDALLGVMEKRGRGR